MPQSRIAKLAQRLMSGDIAWLLHRLRLFLGMARLVARPELLVSQVRSPVASSSLPFDQQGPIKAVIFSHNLDYEGASISLKELVFGLVRHEDIDPTVISFEDGPLRADYEFNGIAIKVLPNILLKISTLKHLKIEVDRLALLIKESGARLVFVNTLLNFPAILAAEHAGIPSIWNPRESEPWDSYFGFLPNPVAQQAIAAIGLPKKVIFVAEATREIWSSFDIMNRFKVIHNGINLDHFPLRNDLNETARCRSELGLKPDSLVLLCVGTLCDRKGQMDLVEAFAVLPKSTSSIIEILLVGDDSSQYAELVRGRCRSLLNGAQTKIRIIPPTKAIWKFYAAADIFVLSSKVESFPRVVLEAMAFGLPIITTPVFGVLEQVIEGENALFYPPGDSRLLAEKIEKLVNDNGLRIRMGESSRQRMTQLITYDEMIAAYARICRDAAI